MFRAPATFGPPSMFGPSRMFGGRGPAAATGVESEWCVSFDGSNDYLELSSGIALTGEFSISLWMKTSVSGSLAGWRTLVGFSSSGDGIFIQSSAAYLYLESVTTGSKSFTDTTTTTDANWHNVCMTRDAGNVIRIYVDGVVSSNTPTRTGTITVQRFAGRAAGEAFGGWQDDLRVFSTALTVAQIRSLARGQSVAGAVGWWKGDETSGTLVADYGSGGNNGTCVGGVTRSTDVSPWLAQ